MSAGARFQGMPEEPATQGPAPGRREDRAKERRRENVEGKECGMSERRGRMEGCGKEIAGRGEMDGVKGGTLGLCWRKQRCEGKGVGDAEGVSEFGRETRGKSDRKEAEGLGRGAKRCRKRGGRRGLREHPVFSVGRGFRCPESRRGKAHPCFFAVGWHCQSPASGKKARNSWQHDASPAGERSQRRGDT